MAVEVGRGVKAALWRVPEHAVLQVETDASEFEAAAAGLVRGLEAYEELPEIMEVIEDQASCALQWFGDVLWLPAGPAVVVKVAEQLPKRLVDRIPEVIAHAVADAGVDSARIVTPKQPRVYERFYEEPRAVMLHGFAEPARAATERIVLWERYWDVACAWAARAGNTRVWAGADVRFETDQTSLPQVFRQSGRTVIGCTAVLEDVDAGLVWCAAVTNHMAGTQIRLAVGGRGADPPRHQRAIEELTAVARDLAPDLAYAVIALHDEFSAPLSAMLPERTKPFAQEGTVIPLVDEVVYDAFCYQVLGPRHVQRLGGPPPGPPHSPPAGSSSPSTPTPGSTIPKDGNQTRAAAPSPRSPPATTAATSSAPLSSPIARSTNSRRNASLTAPSPPAPPSPTSESIRTDLGAPQSGHPTRRASAPRCEKPSAQLQGRI